MLRGREGNQVSACRGEEYVVNRAMHLCNPRFSMAGNRARNGVAHVIAFKNLFTLETFFQVF